MKKALFFVSCALFVAAMASCGNKNAEEINNDTVMDTTEQVADTNAVEAGAAEATEIAADDPAMLAAAKEAGQAKCNCYKKNAASVEACIKALLTSTYATYQNNEAFKAAMEQEYQKCVKEKVNAAAKEVTDKAKEAAKTEATKAANKAVSAASSEISKQLTKKN